MVEKVIHCNISMVCSDLVMYVDREELDDVSIYSSSNLHSL